MTKFGHACARIESNGATIVLDPGGLTSPEAVDGADAILITHEHFDHYKIEHLQRTDAAVFTIGAVAKQIQEADAAVRERVRVVAPGEQFTAAGLAVEACGGMHAVIHPDAPSFDNCGFVVDAELCVYHPGDSFDLPERQIDIALVPVSGPWLKLAESIDFGRALAAPHALAIHERLLSDIGLTMVDERLTEMLAMSGSAYQRVADGQDMVL